MSDPLYAQVFLAERILNDNCLDPIITALFRYMKALSSFYRDLRMPPQALNSLCLLLFLPHLGALKSSMVSVAIPRGYPRVPSFPFSLTASLCLEALSSLFYFHSFLNVQLQL